MYNSNYNNLVSINKDKVLWVLEDAYQNYCIVCSIQKIIQHRLQVYTLLEPAADDGSWVQPIF